MRSSGSREALALNTIGVPTFPTDREGVMTATGGAFTYTVWFAVPLRPALSVTTSRTRYDPKAAYTCVGYGVPSVKLPVPLPPLPVPSPKSHCHETMYPSGSYDWYPALKNTVEFTKGTCGYQKNSATGGRSGRWRTRTMRDAEAVRPWSLSVTVKVIV